MILCRAACRSRAAEFGQNLAARQRHDAQPLDLQPAGRVGDLDGRRPIGAGRQSIAQGGQHHVAGPGDVADLPRPRGEQAGLRPTRSAQAIPSRSSVTIAARRRIRSSRRAASGRPRACGSSLPAASAASARFGVMQAQPA